jgi:hydroxymethylglutaryl-CoA synthase
MVGITSYGAYIPLYRLNRAEIGRAWDIPAGSGERAVANYDEDSLTMGVEAARDCLKGIDLNSIDGLFFASTTAPYKDKQTAATIAMVVGLKRESVTMDFSGSLRCGTNALRAAVDTVRSGSANNILIIASEMRLGYPAGPSELSFGDGAAAVLVGNKGVVVEVEGSYSAYEELQDFWRSDRDLFVRSAEDRFIVDEGYNKVIPAAVSGALNRFNLTSKDFSTCVLYLPNQRQIGSVVKKLGFDPKTQAQDTLFSTVGDTGSAMPIMSLVETLEGAITGNRIILVAYGNGCDVFSLKIGDDVEKVKAEDRMGVARFVASKKMLTNYNRYLRWRELVTVQPPARPAIEYRQPGPQALWKENQKELRLVGTKCKNCGTPQYPPQRVCANCRAKDNFEYYSFSDKKAKVFSFCHDHLMATIDPPVTVAVLDFEGGGRMLIDMTDRDPAECEVGMPVDLTFRKLYYVGGIYNYWWKCRPAR